MFQRLINQWRRHPSTAQEEATKKRPLLKTFILAGQSNMLGHGDYTNLPAHLKQTPDNIQIVQRAWERDGKIQDSRQKNTFGPEIGFAYEIANAFPKEEILLIKFAAGGTSIRAWLPDWQPEHKRTVLNHYDGPLFARLISYVEEIGTTLNRQIDIIGFIWSQGRRDAADHDSAHAFGHNLTLFINALRQQWQKPNLPFVFAEAPAPPLQYPVVMSELLYRFPYITELRQQQQNIAKQLPHVTLVSTKGLLPNEDYIYFDTPSEIELGRRFAQAYLTHHAQQQKQADTQRPSPTQTHS